MNPCLLILTDCEGIRQAIRQGDCDDDSRATLGMKGMWDLTRGQP